MGEPKTMTAEDVLDRDDLNMYAQNTEAPWTPKLKAAVAAAALRAMDAVDDRDRQIGRLRLELAVEMGQPVEGWRSTTVDDARLTGPLWDVAVTRDPMGGGWRWVAEIDRGGSGAEVWAYGVATCKLGAMEAADAWLEGIPTPWERG